MTRPRLPHDMVRIHTLIGRPARVEQLPGCHPRRVRGRHGCTHYRTAGVLWMAVEQGHFPAPVRGPWGTAWRAGDVALWALRNQRNPMT